METNQSKQKPLTVFDFVNSITYGKDVELLDEGTESKYIPFMVNRALSYFPDTVLYANDINLFPSLDKYAQYKYLLYAIPKRRRFAKWSKKVNNDDVINISKVYKCNYSKAEQLLRLLNKEQLHTIREIGNSLN